MSEDHNRQWSHILSVCWLESGELNPHTFGFGDQRSTDELHSIGADEEFRNLNILLGRQTLYF